MNFCWVTLYVEDMEESIMFYEEVVGLKIQRQFNQGPGKKFTFLGNGGTEVELIQDSEIQITNMGSGVSLGFEVDSLDDKINFIQEKGFAIHSGPFQPNPAVKFFFILDPNGLQIQFVENKK